MTCGMVEIIVGNLVIPIAHQASFSDHLCRGGLRLLGASGWNLERGPISNEEEGGKRIYFGIRAPKLWGPLL